MTGCDQFLIKHGLTLSTIGKIFQQTPHWNIFPIKQDLTFHAKERICMKCQNLFSVKSKKNITQFVVCWISPESDKG